jgi:hypothetical protein
MKRCISMPREISDNSRLRQNRGIIDINHPEDYIPWIKARDCFRGNGARFEIPDLYYKSRYIHLMSNIEKEVYYTFRSNENVIELFEQVPLLPLSKTEELCDLNDIKHPKNPRTKKNIIMTTDFLLLVKGKDGRKEWKACAVKPSNDLYNNRVRQKLFIEKLYWESKEIQWGVMTEQQINKNYVNNVILCRSGYTGIGNGTKYDILKYLIAQKQIEIDMNRPIDLDDIIVKIQKGDIDIGRESLLNEKGQINH